MHPLFFNGWQPLIRIAIVGVFSYAALILVLRASGKRTLSKMNAYDMVVTMALGAVLTKAMLTAEQTISESVTAIFLLVAFQYILSVASCRLAWFRKVVTAQPALMFLRGQFLEDVMKKERVTHTEIEAAVHEKGVASLNDVEAVILGSNGELNVLPRSSHGSLSEALPLCEDLPVTVACEYHGEITCSDGMAEITLKGPPTYDARLRFLIKDKTFPAALALLRADDGDLLRPESSTATELAYRVAADGRYEARWVAHDIVPNA